MIGADVHGQRGRAASLDGELQQEAADGKNARRFARVGSEGIRQICGMLLLILVTYTNSVWLD